MGQIGPVSHQLMITDLERIVRRTHHCDVEGVQQVKGQGSDQVHKKPGGGVVNANGASVVHHLTRLAHVGGAEVQDNICRTFTSGLTVMKLTVISHLFSLTNETS